MSMISEQINKLREAVKSYRPYVPYYVIGLLHNAADTIESLSTKLADMERSAEDCGGGWIPCSEPPKHNNEVLIFNGKSYSVGYYDGKSWVNAIHPVEWQEIRHEP